MIRSLLTILQFSVCSDLDDIRFERDVRWATHEWEMWTPVDIDSLKIYNDA